MIAVSEYFGAMGFRIRIHIPAGICQKSLRTYIMKEKT
jgi:hypothetical protein